MMDRAGGAGQNEVITLKECAMNPTANPKPDTLDQYVGNVICLQQRVQAMQQKQREALAELLLIREKCRVLRQVLSV